MTATGGGRPLRPVAQAGIVAGTAGLITAYTDGWRPRIPGPPLILGQAAGAVIAWLVFVIAAGAIAELLRRHHKTMARAAGRGAKRAALAAGRAARTSSRSVTATAATRWQARQHQPLMFTPASNGAAQPEPATGQQPGEMPMDTQTVADKRFSGLREPGYTGQDGRIPGPIDPVTGRMVAALRALHNLRNVNPTNSQPGEETMARRIMDRSRWHPVDLPDGVPYERDAADKPNARDAAANQALHRADHERWQAAERRHRDALDKGADRVTKEAVTVPAPPPPAPIPQPRSGQASVPGEWKQVVAAAADFEPEDDGELIAWMASEVAGMSAYAEALTEVYETCVNSIGVDPAAMNAVHDTADAAAEAATAMAYARNKFASHYAEVREFAASGGLLPYDGRWITGDGDA